MDVNVLLQRDGVGGGSLGGVDDFGVDLGGGHVFVGQHLADGEDVGAHSELDCSECVAERVEGDSAGDSGLFQPCFQRVVNHVALQALEDESGGAWKNRSRMGQRAGGRWDTFDAAKLVIFS